MTETIIVKARSSKCKLSGCLSCDLGKICSFIGTAVISQSWFDCHNQFPFKIVNKLIETRKCFVIVSLCIYNGNSVWRDLWDREILFKCYTVEPLYNEVLGTMKITLLYQVSHYIRVKKTKKYKELEPAKLPRYKRILLYPTSL